MNENSFERMKTRNGGPSPVIEDTSRVDEEITASLNCIAAWFADGDRPFIVPTHPVGTNDLVLEGNVLPQIVLLDKVGEVLENLTRAGIVGRPVELGFKGKGVIVSWYVASASWIPVLVPGAANVGILLVDMKREIGEKVLELVGQVNPRCPGTHTNHSHVAIGVDRLPAHLPFYPGAARRVAVGEICAWDMRHCEAKGPTRLSGNRETTIHPSPIMRTKSWSK